MAVAEGGVSMDAQALSRVSDAQKVLHAGRVLQQLGFVVNPGEGRPGQAGERLEAASAAVPLVPGTGPSPAGELDIAAVRAGAERLHALVGQVLDLPALIEATDLLGYLAQLGRAEPVQRHQQSLEFPLPHGKPTPSTRWPTYYQHRFVTEPFYLAT